MPREQRKRGKKHRKVEEPVNEPVEETFIDDPGEGPSWIVQNDAAPEQNDDFPFGVPDPDIKAYFRMVDEKIKEWQASYGLTDDEAGLVDGEDPNEARRIFLNAALEELSGKEFQLATDPECSVVLERMMYSMDDFSRRVFFDRLLGSLEQLACHRFASHVCQTLFSVCAETVSRECKGIKSSTSKGDGEGVLRTMTELLSAAHGELLPSMSKLIMDPFAPHVLGSFLILLTGNNLQSASGAPDAAVRSKKSTKYRAKQGQMSSIIHGSADAPSGVVVPTHFSVLSQETVSEVTKQMDSNSIRALASNKTANPLMQLFIRLEALGNDADSPGSIMDAFVAGLVTNVCNDEPQTAASDYVETMLRDTTASHILETILSVAPDRIVARIWEIYFRGRLAKLAIHPVANFIVAAAVCRLWKADLAEFFSEMKGKWSGALKHVRTGAIRAAITRSAELGDGRDAIDAAVSMFGFEDEEDRKSFVRCVLACISLETYKETRPSLLPANPEDTDQSTNRKAKRAEYENPAITMQGSLLLQAMLRLPQPFNQVVLDSIEALTVSERIALAHNSTGSRVLDALLDSPSVPIKAKRMFITAFIGHYNALVDNVIGSRIGDHCWAKADTFLKEKIVRSLFDQEAFLAASPYGRFFARKLRIPLLKRKPDDWRAAQVSTDHPKPPAPHTAAETVGKAQPQVSADEPPSKKRKRRQEVDEIDVLFKSAGKKRKVLDPAHVNGPTGQANGKTLLDTADKTLLQVLDAIKETSTNEKAVSNPKKKKLKT